MRTRAHTRNRLYISLALLGLALLALWPSVASAMPLNARQWLERAWRHASAVGQFEYATDVRQTTHPTARLSNAGRSSEARWIAPTRRWS